MNTLSAILVSAAMLANAAQAAVVLDTTGVRWWGFTMVSNVAGYANMTLDACDIKAAVASGNLTKALDLYSNGKNSMGGSGLRKFMTWAASQHPGEPTFDQLEVYHKNGSWLDVAILKAFADKQGDYAVALIDVATHYKYFFHEVDAAYSKTAAINGNVNYTSGAPHNLDEAWVLYAGAHPDLCTSLYSIAKTLAAEMGTSYAGRAAVNWAVTGYMNDIQYYTMTGNSTIKSFDTALAALRVQVGTMLAQGFLREAYSASVGSACKKAPIVAAGRNKALAYWSVLAPQLVAWGAKPTDMAKVASALTASNVNYVAVRKALVTVLGPIKATTLGNPNHVAIIKDKSCKAVPIA